MKMEILLGLAVLVVGCGSAARTPKDEAARQVCLVNADLAADERARNECPDAWSTCDARLSIMAELEAKQEKCR